MKRKQVLSMMMAFAMAAAVAFPAITVQASGLTQAANTSQVTYGKATAEDVAILKQLFDADYYISNNPDVAQALGSDAEAVFNHFCTLGVFEGRQCTASFNPSAYASANKDLYLAFGDDVLKYYWHYVTFGMAEGRAFTTLDSALSNGYTVTSLTNKDIVITPVVYKVAKLMGTEDYTAVMFQLERAAKQAEATGSSTSIIVGDDTIVLTPSNGTSSDSSGSTDTGSDSTSTEPANTFSSGVVAVGSYTNNISNGASSNYGTFTIRYYKGKSGYAGYDPGDRDNSNPESKVKTQNYDPDFDSDNKLKAANIIGDAGFIAYSNLSNQLVTGASIQENMLEHKLEITTNSTTSDSQNNIVDTAGSSNLTQTYNVTVELEDTGNGMKITEKETNSSTDFYVEATIEVELSE